MLDRHRPGVDRKEMTDGVLLTDEGRDRRIKCVRRWLKHVRSCVTKMRSCEDELMAERDRCDMLKGIAYDKDGRSSALLNGDDAIAAHISRIADIVSRMDDRSREYHDAVNGARDVLGKLECHELAGTVLEEHYLQRRTWERVADDVGYEERQARRIADDAMVECYDLMPHEWRERIPRADG